MTIDIQAKSQLDLRSNPNLFINGDGSVAQRGTNGTGAQARDYVSVDRWFVGNNSGLLQVQTGDTSTVPYNMRLRAEGGSYNHMGQRIENCKHLQGKQVTLSFQLVLATGANIADGYVSLGFAPPEDSTRRSTVNDFNIDFTITGYKTVTFTVPTDYVNGDCLDVRINCNQATSVDEEIYVAELKLELGSVATPFVPDDPHTNLAKCQRYYEEGDWISDRVLATTPNFTVSTCRFVQIKRDIPNITCTKTGLAAELESYGTQLLTSAAFDIQCSGSPSAYAKGTFIADAEL